MSVTVVEAVGTLGTALSRRFPLGVSRLPGSHGPDAANVAVYAPVRSQVVLCYRAPESNWKAVLLPDVTDGIHHGLVTGFPVGSLYGFYACPAGTEPLEVDPESVQLLLDPYGRYIEESIDDAGTTTYYSVRMASEFDWGDVARPNISRRNTVFYEAHVRGQTMLHPEIPEEIRGTYAGMAHPVMIKHLKELGVTAIQLLPIHFHIDEPHLHGTGMRNYWGYNTLGFFAPQVDYASEDAQSRGPMAVQDELKGMIKLLHMAGIEVILDVVYNHTAEGGPGGPALSWRGLAEEQYYRMHDGHYVDTTGCGNTLNFGNPHVIKMAMDSLRYWVEEFHIDGFRFDLAVSLARDGVHHFNSQHPFLLAAATDGVLSSTKLISEPWDLGMDGWQTGNFPTGWSDWNDSFRDTVREVWLSDRAARFDGHHHGTLAKFGDALGGSQGLFARSGRTPMSSVNLVTAHDGFTMADLTAYNYKHNEDNQEGNRDGHDHNRSWNHGIEGITADPQILAQRGRTARNLMSTLMLAMGVPMISAGDELGRSQGGNNNAYCQDNEIAWLDWTLDAEALTMLDATKHLIGIRKEFLAEQPSSYPSREGESFIHWFGTDGKAMTAEKWLSPHERVLTMLIGSPNGSVDGLAIFNTGVSDAEVTLPLNPRYEGIADAKPRPYSLQFTSSAPTLKNDAAPSFRVPRSLPSLPAGEKVVVEANTVQIYRNRIR